MRLFALNQLHLNSSNSKSPFDSPQGAIIRKATLQCFEIVKGGIFLTFLPLFILTFYLLSPTFQGGWSCIGELSERFSFSG